MPRPESYMRWTSLYNLTKVHSEGWGAVFDQQFHCGGQCRFVAICNTRASKDRGNEFCNTLNVGCLRSLLIHPFRVCFRLPGTCTVLKFYNNWKSEHIIYCIRKVASTANFEYIRYEHCSDLHQYSINMFIGYSSSARFTMNLTLDQYLVPCDIITISLQ